MRRIPSPARMSRLWKRAAHPAEVSQSLPMRVGVYVDGFNLYYGARAMCGRGTPGWRWLDIGGLAQTLVNKYSLWSVNQLVPVTYCTARVSGSMNDRGSQTQDVYLRALKLSGSVTHIEYGTYITRVATAPLATKGPGSRPSLVAATWPLMVQDADGGTVPGATFMVSVARREEKATDVNLASHVLVDVLTGAVDAIVVISNDSDLAFPIRFARDYVPVGLVNPTPGYPAGRLAAAASSGVGDHWWCQLTARDFFAHQLPTSVGRGAIKPQHW